MGLTIRMILYFVFAFVAGQGIATFDPDAGTLTFDIEHLSTVMTGLAGYVTTFATSRIVKRRGGLT